MKMKKVVSMLLVGAMTLSLAACSGGKSSGSSDDKSSSKGGSDKKSYHVIYLTPSKHPSSGHMLESVLRTL